MNRLGPPFVVFLFVFAVHAFAQGNAGPVGGKLAVSKGVCVVMGEKATESALRIARESSMTVYVQIEAENELEAARKAVAAAGLYSRICIEKGTPARIHLADNLADLVLASEDKRLDEAEVLRVLNPLGKAWIGQKQLGKPFADGVDNWSHPYHGPDNNPQSTDQLARAPYRTQFLAEPLFCAMPEVTVVSGGRVFKAFGHRATRGYQNATINTLHAFNAYNGTLLWTQPLKKGFMIHRNTLIATPEVLYLADDQSCKRIDAATGKILGEIAPKRETEAVWKWMAMGDGRLYALLGGPEFSVAVQQGPETDAITRGWNWGQMWPGYNPAKSAAFELGHTLLALDPRDGKVIWSHKEEFALDGRAVCMKGGRLYAFGPGKALVCLDAATGRVAWKNSNADLLEAVGADAAAQTPWTGFVTSAYMKCTDKTILFAGPQRPNLVAASPVDGKLLWTKQGGNYHLLLREDAIYAFGPGGPSKTGGSSASAKFDYLTGKVLGALPLRTSCARITGSVDSIFDRSQSGETLMTSGACTTWFDPASSNTQLSLIAPMRPACTDGVIVANGSLYLGPWVCGCNSTLFGFAALTPAGKQHRAPGTEAQALEVQAGFDGPLSPFETQDKDWPAYQADSHHSGISKVVVPDHPTIAWEARAPAGSFPTAPVAAGGLVFVAGSEGLVRALDARDGKIVWSAGVSGGIFYPPAIWKGRCFVGCNDGWIYAFEAASGRRLWRFRAAPAERKISIFGSLVSTWPVSCGVVVEDGVLYAAAGLTHYDGVHVYALDAMTGQVKWHYAAPEGAISITVGAKSSKMPNTTPLAKALAPSGSLWVKDGKLQLPAGNFCGVAEFDLTTGTLVSTRSVTRSDYRPFARCYITEMTGGDEKDRPVVFPPTLWRARLPEFVLPEGTIMGMEDRALSPSRMTLALYLPSGAAGENNSRSVWSTEIEAYRGAAVASGTLLLLGQVQKKKNGPNSLTAVAVKDGGLLWSQPLPAAPVGWGIAVERSGRILVCLEDGRLICFAAK